MNKILLRSRMVERGITQEEMAKMLNLSTTTMSHKINGKTEFVQSELVSIRSILHLNDMECMRIFFDKE